MPYHSWAISHAHHHANTCSMEDDEVFVPENHEEFGLRKSLSESPLAELWGVFLMVTVGW